METGGGNQILSQAWHRAQSFPNEQVTKVQENHLRAPEQLWRGMGLESMTLGLGLFGHFTENICVSALSFPCPGQFSLSFSLSWPHYV